MLLNNEGFVLSSWVHLHVFLPNLQRETTLWLVAHLKLGIGSFGSRFFSLRIDARLTGRQHEMEELRLLKLYPLNIKIALREIAS